MCARASENGVSDRTQFALTRLVVGLASLSLCLPITWTQVPAPPGGLTAQVFAYNNPAEAAIRIRQLRDGNPSVRASAALALGRISPPTIEIITALRSALTDRDKDVRQVAALALAAIGPLAADAVPTLIAAVKDPAAAVRSGAAFALWRIGPFAKEAVPALIGALQDADTGVREQATTALGGITPGESRVIVALIGALKDPAPVVRSSAAHAMANIGPGAKDAVFALIAALQDRDTDVRQEAANALGSTGSGTKEATPALIGALKDPNTALNAALSIGRIGPGASEAVPALIGALSNPNLDLRDNAITALAKIAPGSREVLHALIAALGDPNVAFRQQAAGALGLIGPGAKEAVPALIAALQDPDSGVRVDAAGALGSIGPGGNEAVPALISALRNPNTTLRGNAAYALGEIRPGGKKAVPALIAALKDPAANVRGQAANALVVVAEAAWDTKRTEMTEQLELAAQTLAASGFISSAERVRTVAGFLRATQPPWYQRLLAKLGQHPTVATVAVFYLALFLVSLVLLAVYPLGLLGLSQAAERMSTAPMITKAIGLGEIVFVFGLFRYHLRVLDAWTAKYIGRARNQFNSLPTAKQREVHVAEMPVELDREVIPGLRPEDLEQSFSRNRTILLLWGEGGSGKTSLACQIARWVMSDDRATRPCAQRMLPILIEQDLSLEVGKDKVVLTEVMRGRLKELTGEIDAPSPDLVRHLLKRKRVLLIADGLSELNEATRSRLHPMDPEFSANALVVTSRLEESLDSITKTVLHPHRIKGNRLSSFMEAYLNLCGKRALFDDPEFFEGCKRLSTMVGERDTTVLLAKLYAEQMIAVKEGHAREHLPESVPDLMLEYLNRINRRASGMDDRSVHTAAKIIAWECLRHTFRPVPAKLDVVLSALGEDAEAYLERLGQKLRLVETIGVARDRIRFTLDPLAEYLAGLYLVEQNRDNEDSWRQFLAQAGAVPGAPETTKGFLLAIRDCCHAKGAEWNVPLWVVGELARQVGFDGGASKKAQVDQRVKDHMLRPRLPVSEPSETDK